MGYSGAQLAFHLSMFPIVAAFTGLSREAPDSNLLAESLMPDAIRYIYASPPNFLHSGEPAGAGLHDFGRGDHEVEVVPDLPDEPELMPKVAAEVEAPPEEKKVPVPKKSENTVMEDAVARSRWATDWANKYVPEWAGGRTSREETEAKGKADATKPSARSTGTPNTSGRRVSQTGPVVEPVVPGESINTRADPKKEPAGSVSHSGQDCWDSCNRQQGRCRWCGAGSCCRKGWADEFVGCDGQMGHPDYHVCVAAGDHSTPPAPVVNEGAGKSGGVVGEVPSADEPLGGIGPPEKVAEAPPPPPKTMPPSEAILTTPPPVNVEEPLENVKPLAPGAGMPARGGNVQQPLYFSLFLLGVLVTFCCGAGCFGCYSKYSMVATEDQLKAALEKLRTLARVALMAERAYGTPVPVMILRLRFLVKKAKYNQGKALKAWRTMLYDTVKKELLKEHRKSCKGLEKEELRKQEDGIRARLDEEKVRTMEQAQRDWDDGTCPDPVPSLPAVESELAKLEVEWKAIEANEAARS